MRRLLLLAFLCWPVTVTAQPVTTIVSSLQTTNTGTTSLQVGCAIGSGTCTGGIVAGPLSVGPISIGSGYVEIQSFVPVSQTNRLVNNSGTLQWNGSTLAIGGSISGTTNTIPLFTASNAIGNSIMTQSGTTITVANTLSATTLTGTISTASQPNITGLGTITSGTWGSAATKIGLASGGTNADLSGTGGTSQFLRQNSLGAAVTVVRPAVADLSDASNVALLNAVNTFTGFGANAFSTSGTGSNLVRVRNTAAGTTNAAYVTADNDSSVDRMFMEIFSTTYTPTQNWHAADGGAVISQGVGGMSIGAINASGAVRFYTGGSTLRWGINSAGDFTFGASSHVADSSGTPTITGGGGTGGTIAGTDYAFVVTMGTGSPASVTIGFGHTFSNNVVCTANSDASAQSPIVPGTATTTSIILSAATGTFTNGAHVYAQCRGY